MKICQRLIGRAVILLLCHNVNGSQNIFLHNAHKTALDQIDPAIQALPSQQQLATDTLKKAFADSVLEYLAYARSVKPAELKTVRAHKDADTHKITGVDTKSLLEQALAVAEDRMLYALHDNEKQKNIIYTDMYGKIDLALKTEYAKEMGRKLLHEYELINKSARESITTAPDITLLKAAFKKSVIALRNFYTWADKKGREKTKNNWQVKLDGLKIDLQEKTPDLADLLELALAQAEYDILNAAGDKTKEGAVITAMEEKINHYLKPPPKKLTEQEVFEKQQDTLKKQQEVFEKQQDTLKKQSELIKQELFKKQLDTLKKQTELKKQLDTLKKQTELKKQLDALKQQEGLKKQEPEQPEPPIQTLLLLAESLHNISQGN